MGRREREGGHMKACGGNRGRTGFCGRYFTLWCIVTLAAIVGANVFTTAADAASQRADKRERVFEGPVPRADCGPGSIPEPSDKLQGQAPPEDSKGYRCNLKLVGHQGTSASWQLAWYGDCAYYGQDFPPVNETYPYGGEPGRQRSFGTVVVDASDPKRPEATGLLMTPAMLQPHESLKANEKRGLLAGVAGWSPHGGGPLFFDVYDVSEECAQPELEASVPVHPGVGHEGGWAPNGKTYYASGAYEGSIHGLGTASISAIDVADPSNPSLIARIPVEPTHGLSISADGTRAYLATIGGFEPTFGPRNGLTILDVSDIQRRTPNPQTSVIGGVYWEDGCLGQSTIPVTIKRKPYVIFFDEMCVGSARIIDVSDERHPKVVSKLKLELHFLPGAAEAGPSGVQGTHYCGVDRLKKATVLGCTFWGESGVRVFDIRNPYRPKEIAYFNLPGSFVASDVRFVRKRGEVWFTDQNNGLYILRFTNGAWPFSKKR